MKKLLLLTALLGIFSASCTEQKGKVSQEDLLGSWICVMPEGLNITQGVTLEQDGKATSIGMATLKYESWQVLDGDRLVLTGQSIGNGQTIQFSDTLNIATLTADSLVLAKEAGYKQEYFREKN